MTASPGIGVSERDASVGNLLGHQDPGKENKRRKKTKKASKGGIDGEVSVAVGAGSSAPTKRSRSDGSTSRELKIGKLNEDDRRYSRALADPNKLAIVTAEYLVVRFSEEQGKLVETALETALDGMTTFLDSLTAGPLAVPCCVTVVGPQDGAWPREAVNKLEPRTGAKLMVLEAGS